MLLSVIYSFKRHSLISLLLASAISITACGGGGGGGGGGGFPKKVSVEFPLDEGTIDDASADFEIAFADSVTNASSLEVILNSVDVTAMFTPSTGTANRTATIYSLTGILEEGADNCLTVKMSGSQNSGVCFTYDAKPEVILTSLTGTGPFTANGATRVATLASVTLNSILADSITLPAPTAHAFARAFDTMPPLRSGASSIVDTSDFDIIATDADGDTETTQFVVPKTTIKYGAAIQMNNSAFNVIEKWVGELMENELNAAFTEFVANPHADIADASSAYDDTGLTAILEIGDGGVSNTDCQFVNFVSGVTEDDCKLFVSKVENTGAVTTNVTVLDSGSSSDDTFPLEVAVSFEQLNVTIDNPAFDGLLNYTGALISTLQFGAGANPDVVFTVVVNVSKTTGKIMDFSLPVSPYSLDLGTATAVNSSCNICGGKTAGQMNGTLSGVGTGAVGTLETQVVAELVTRLTPDLEAALADASVSNTTLIYPVKNTLDVQVSSLNFAFSGSDVTESKQASTVVGGFIGLGGSTYADDDDSGDANDTAALGSYFDPLNASIITSKLMGTSDDVVIALSENSLNQLLLAVYQSRVLNLNQQDLKISDLGTTAGSLGKLIVDQSAAFAVLNYDLDYDDDVSIIVSLEAVPHANFINAATSGLELKLYAVRVIVRVYRDGSPTPVGGVADTLNLLVDVKALVNYGLDSSTSLPFTSIDTGNVVLDVQSVSSFQNLVTEASVLEVFPEFLGTYIQDSIAVFNEPVIQNVNLAGLGLFDISAWLVLQDLTVDAQEEFIKLSATVVDVEPTLPEKGIFRLNITDTTCDVVTPPVECPNYVAP